MKQIYTLALVLLSCLCSHAQTRGATALNNPDAPEGTTYAIVIGISGYKNLPPLQYADKDARAFYDFLVSNEGMNLDSSNVSLWVNEGANINNLGNSVSDILQKDIKKGDKVMFYFAGHGDYDAKIMKNQSLLLLQGAPNGNYFQNVFSGDYISTSDLHIKFTSELIEKGAEVMLIIDACHSGGLNTPLAGGEQGGIITANALNTIQSTVKLYSCQASQYSLESTQFGGGRGLFSYVLMEGLYGMADANNDTSVSMKELQRYLEDNVPVLAKPNKQDPVIKTEDNTMVVCRVNEDLLRKYKKAKDKNLPFLIAANIKGNEEAWMKGMSITQQELYKNCKQHIENKYVEEAYTVYKLFELQDNSSDASIILRRNLSAALQEKAAKLLMPMFEDVSKVEASIEDVEQARNDLDLAAELLGKEHFLYKNLQARNLFLKSLLSIANGDNMSNPEECIKDLELSVSLEPNAPYTYFYLSRAYSDADKKTDAVKTMKKYIELIPNSFWAHNNYGMLFIDLKKYEEAEQEFKIVLEDLKPGHITSLLNYGYLLYLLNRHEEAEKQYKRATELAPGRSDIHIYYGKFLYDLKRYEEAEKEYLKAIELDPNSALLHFDYGLFLYNVKRYEEAEKEYKKAIAQKADYTDAHINYGVLLNNLKRYEEAEREYLKAIELNPGDALSHNNYGLLLYKVERYEEAEKEYKKVIALKADYTDVHINCGNVFYNLNRYEEAERAYLKAIELNPGEALSYYNYGLLLNEQMRYEEAEKQYQKAIELDPEYEDAHINYAFLLHNLKRFEEAEKEYKKAMELNPGNMETYKNYGYLLYHMNRFEEAIRFYHSYISVSSDFTYGYNAIAHIYMTNIQQYDSSACYYHKLMSINKNDTISIEKYAYSLLRLNKTDEAIQVFENVVIQFPGYAWGYYNLACVYSLQDDKGKALMYFGNALQKGIREPAHWQQDRDVDNIRTQPEFKTILLRYYSQDELDKYPDLFIVKKQ